mmetsp:Transcript_12717/g.29620  ORF Transcript_12717/g.29620 Transcript_12717/m.29620 type:complete len:233 (+) Transcript_12717:424-1122(+)
MKQPQQCGDLLCPTPPHSVAAASPSPSPSPFPASSAASPPSSSFESSSSFFSALLPSSGAASVGSTAAAGGLESLAVGALLSASSCSAGSLAAAARASAAFCSISFGSLSLSSSHIFFSAMYLSLAAVARSSYLFFISASISRHISPSFLPMSVNEMPGFSALTDSRCSLEKSTNAVAGFFGPPFSCFLLFRRIFPPAVACATSGMPMTFCWKWWGMGGMPNPGIMWYGGIA